MEQRGVHKNTFHQPQNTNSLRDTENNTMHMVFEGELAVKLLAKDFEVGLAWIETPDKTKHHGSNGPTNDYKALVLLGFSIMHQ